MNSWNLLGYLGETFPSLTLVNGLFYKWPLGIRFEIGLDAVPERPAALFESVFPPDDICVLVDQDWPMLGFTAEQMSRYFTLFSLPDVFDNTRETSELELRVEGEQEPGLDRYTLRWAESESRSFDYRRVFQAIANTDHGMTPAMRSRVYIINPATDTIFHMYDDRGLDIVSPRTESLLPLYYGFKDWVLDYDRERIVAALGI